jgi:RNA polymerase primary sigma factor
MEKKKTKVCDKEQYPSIEDELQLIKDIKSGGIERKTAIEKLSYSKLRLVTAVAKMFKGYNLPMEELISAGNEGLVSAAENYDETRGFKFMSYAVWWIRQSIMQKIQ